MNKFLGIFMVVLGIAVAVIPVYSDCQSQGRYLTTSAGAQVSMKCHWTGVAEIAVGVPLLAVGVLIAASRRKRYLFHLGIMGVILGAFVILLPNKLIGVCATPTMICHTLMKPSLIILGSLVIITSLITLWLARKSED